MLLTHLNTIERQPALNALAQLRQEWESAAEEGSLLEVKASVGLLLFDVVNALGFPDQDAAFVLGRPLLHAINEQ